MKELKKFLEISKKWDKDFKGDLLENLVDEFDDITVFLDLLINEWTPIWIEENPDLTVIYLNYKLKFEELDNDKIKKEYALARKLFFYVRQLDEEDIEFKGKSFSIEDIVNCHLIYSHNDNEMTFEECKQKLFKLLKEEVRKFKF